MRGAHYCAKCRERFRVYARTKGQLSPKQRQMLVMAKHAIGSRGVHVAELGGKNTVCSLERRGLV